MFTFSLNAEVMNFSIQQQEHKFLDAKEICKQAGKHLDILIDQTHPAILDCTGKRISLTRLCQKNFPGTGKFLRGINQTEGKKVVCQFGEGAHFSLECFEKHKNLCLDARSGCEKISQIYAKEHSVLRADIKSEYQRPNKLNCFFQAKPNLKTEIPSKILPSLL